MKDTSLLEQWIIAVRNAGEYEGKNHELYALNRNLANRLEKELIALNFDFSRDNIKKLCPYMF